MEQEVITDIIKNNSLSHFLEYEGTQLSTLFFIFTSPHSNIVILLECKSSIYHIIYKNYLFSLFYDMLLNLNLYYYPVIFVPN